MDNLAKEVNLSVSSFYRLFKDVTSDTPVQYLKKIRLNKAKEMIITQNAKAYVAALEVGYRNCEIFLPFFNFLKNITFWCQSTQENVYGTNKQCCSH